MRVLDRYPPTIPEYAFHSTPFGNVAAILEEGLKRRVPRIWDQSLKKNIYLSPPDFDAEYQEWDDAYQWGVDVYKHLISEDVRLRCKASYRDGYSECSNLRKNFAKRRDLWKYPRIIEGIGILKVNLVDLPSVKLIRTRYIAHPREIQVSEDIESWRISIVARVPPEETISILKDWIKRRMWV
jgi:hypothetical protein